MESRLKAVQNEVTDYERRFQDIDKTIMRHSKELETEVENVRQQIISNL